MGKTAAEKMHLGTFPAEQRDAFCVFAKPHKGEAEISLEPLLGKVQIDQRPPDLHRKQSANASIDQRCPHQIGGNMNASPRAERNSCRPGETPENE